MIEESTVTTEQPKKRGFAALTPERRKEIASMGGKQANANGTRYSYTPEQAREACRKSLEVRRAKAAAKIAVKMVPYDQIG